MTPGRYDARLGGVWARRPHEPRATWPENATTDAIILLRAHVDFTHPDGPTLGDSIALNAALHLEGRHPTISSVREFWDAQAGGVA